MQIKPPALSLHVCLTEWVILLWLTCTGGLPKASYPFELPCASSVSRADTHELCFSGCHMTHWWLACRLGSFFFSPELSWLKSGKSASSFFAAPYRPWIDLEVLQTLKIGWPSNGESKRLLEWAKLQGKIRQAQQTKLWAVQTYPRLLKQVKAHTWRTASFPELSKMSLLILSGNKQFSSFQCSDTMA